MIKQNIQNNVITESEDTHVAITSEIPTEISLDNIIDHSPRVIKNTKISGVITTILNFDDSTNHYFIQNPFDRIEQILVTKSILDINENMIGKDVLVSFEEEDIYRPIITGVVQTLNVPTNKSIKSKKSDETSVQTTIDDAERLVFTAKKEIVLQCGKSSIHLTKAGKVIIRGSYVLSRSTGMNSLKGGSVSIN